MVDMGEASLVIEPGTMCRVWRNVRRKADFPRREVPATIKLNCSKAWDFLRRIVGAMAGLEGKRMCKVCVEEKEEGEEEKVNVKTPRECEESG